MDKKKVIKQLEQAINAMLKYNTTFEDRYRTRAFNLVQDARREIRKSDWVSVEDGLPEYGENVLAISKDGNMNVSYRRKITRDKISPEVMDDNGFILNFNLRCSSITHWK